MDIHAPEHPIQSLKDFGIHIAVVTVGILIALGLEGLRETIYERHLVRETRANVHREMTNDHTHSVEELDRVTLYRDQLKALVAAMPTLERAHPAAFTARLQTVTNPGYFFSANAWTAALSTGALAHMQPEEVSAYAYAAEGIRRYTELQSQAQLQEARTQAFFLAHPTLNDDQFAEAYERLMLFYHAEESLAFVCPQMQYDIERAIDTSK